ncbi:glycosyltransferase [bacterium]|nr:glycosyltransferase [bacterium]
MASALIISFVEWAGAFQRPQHMAVGLARRGWDVTYMSPGYVHRKSKRVASGVELPKNLRVVEPMGLPGGSRIAAIDSINIGFMRRAALNITQQPWDVVIFNDPRWHAVAAGIPARRRIFDYMDDLSAHIINPEDCTAREAAALSIVDRVWTGTASLADRLAGRHPSARFVPCGVDAALFARPNPKFDAGIERDLPPGGGPLAGYFGALNERFDTARVTAFLDAAPWRLLLIGPASSRFEPLPETDRVRCIGPRPYVMLPSYLARFDLALIPYDTTGPHRFLYPVKALEYLAGGKPVLSTPLPDVVRFLSNFVELADTAQDWRDRSQYLFADRAAATEKARAGQTYTASRTWDAMIDDMQTDMVL